MSDSIEVLVVGADCSVRLGTMPRGGGLDYLQSQVANGTGESRGWVECVAFPRYDLWCHEDGKVIGLPENKVATALLRHTHGGEDYVVGDVVLTGPVDDYGYSTSLPGYIIEAVARISEVVRLMPRTFAVTPL
jgi:hypothetical protein